MESLLNFIGQLRLTSFLSSWLASSAIAAIFILLLRWSFKHSSKVKRNLPPSPRSLPFIGNLHQVGMFPHRTLHAMAKSHGNIMQLRFGRVPVLVISSAGAASLIMKTHDIIFANRPKSSIFKRLLYDFKDIASAPYGEYWRQTKSISVLHLLSTTMVRSFHSVRVEEAGRTIDKIKQASSSSSSPVNLSQMFSEFSNDVVCRIALGRRYSGQDGGRTFKELLGEFSDLLGSLAVGDYIPWLSWVNHINGFNGRVEKVAKELDGFLDGIMEERMGCQKREGEGHDHAIQHEERKDFLDILLRLQKENTLGIPLARVSIKAIILDMFAAGTDTTSTAMEWAMTELLRHPDIMKKLQEEVRETAKGREITEEDIHKMKYLKAVIKETLRLHPPIPLLVFRECLQDVKVHGYDIAAGTQVIVNAWAIGREPASWEREEAFWPDRFLNSAIDFKGQDFELIPFGAGRRGCPGIQFANAAIEVALANVILKFDWELAGGAGELDMTETTGITAHRKYPLVAIATPRAF